jgi:hypothetical protein
MLGEEFSAVTADVVFDGRHSVGSLWARID